MASTIYAPLKPTLGYRLHEKLKCVGTTMNDAKILCFVQYIILKISKQQHFVCLTASQPAVRPSCASATAPAFSHNDTKQIQQVMMEDPTVCEFDEVYDGIEEGRKMAVAAKLGKNKELKLQDKQTEMAGRKRD